MRSRHRFAAVALAAGVAIIAVATLTPRPGAATSSGICIFCGSRGLADFIANVGLFMPAGAALALVGVSVRRVAIAGVLASLCIEILQLGLVQGRDASAGDVLSNGMGAYLGAAATIVWRRWLASDAGELTRCTLLTLAVCCALLAGLAMFLPFLPATTYHLQWAPRLGHLEAWEGEVLDAQLGSASLNGPPWRMSAARRDVVRRFLPFSPIVVRAVAAPAPTAVAPIVSIFDNYNLEIMLLGADGPHAVFRYRSFANFMRLDPPGLRIDGVFGLVPAGDTMRLVVHHDGARTCAVVNRQSILCETGYTVGDVWKTLIIPGGNDQRSHAALDVLWLFALFLPVGITAAKWQSAVCGAGMLVALLTLVPLTIGFASTPLPELVAAACGMAAGHILRKVLRRGFGAAEYVRFRDGADHATR